MSEQAGYRAGDRQKLRVLFCIGVMPAFFEAPSSEVSPVTGAVREAFDDLAGRFGVQVIGTMDDDELMVGPSSNWPWTAYVLADAPGLEAVASVCNIMRDTAVGEHRLWRYMRIEARVGRPLFFANS